MATDKLVSWTLNPRLMNLDSVLENATSIRDIVEEQKRIVRAFEKTPTHGRAVAKVLGRAEVIRETERQIGEERIAIIFRNRIKEKTFRERDFTQLEKRAKTDLERRAIREVREEKFGTREERRALAEAFSERVGRARSERSLESLRGQVRSSDIGPSLQRDIELEIELRGQELRGEEIG